MTTTALPLDDRTPGGATVANAAPRAALPRFWVLQGAGWLAFGVAMTLSRVGVYPIGFMIVAKGVLTALGFLASLVLWRVYRRVLRERPTVARMIVISVVASYLAAMAWTVAANLIDVPLYDWLLDRRIRIRGVVGLFGGSVYHAFALLAWSILYFAIKHYEALQIERERTLRAEALAHRAQLEALRYQLNPHFLFNTLNAVSTLVVEGRNGEAGRMIARLSDFLRLTLSEPTAEEVALADEIEFARRYLEIEQVRFGDRLAVRVEVEPEAWRARVPSLILQPLVENAIRHGIASREEGGCIAIEARRDGDRLRLVVTDDGRGPPSAGAPAASTPPESDDRRHVGLANTRERLRHLHGDAHRLELREEGDGRGASVVIELPFRLT
jgi:anti-sigma regulatory factor (Ser/Thr protein kinase)